MAACNCFFVCLFVCLFACFQMTQINCVSKFLPESDHLFVRESV